MNKIKERRQELGLRQADLALVLRKQEPRVDISMVSRYEANVCLPTLMQLEMLERLLRMDRTQLYDLEDLDLLETADPEEIGKAKRRRDHRSKRFYRKCFRISRQQAKLIPKDLLAVCGYSSWQSWFDEALWALLNYYDRRKV